jgi:NDP-sugar pyrophosphorylase family protein
VIGHVVIHAGVNIWPYATIRGDSRPIIIGENSNVQECCVLHADPGFPLTIAANVTIGHQAVVHGCTNGEGSLIGIQAIVLNGARIGATADRCWRVVTGSEIPTTAGARFTGQGRARWTGRDRRHAGHGQLCNAASTTRTRCSRLTFRRRIAC